MTYRTRVRPATDGATETFEEPEEAHARFAELCIEHPDARVSLYGPGGVLLRRRPELAEACRVCGAPSSGTWPVTGTTSDHANRVHDVFALCAQHHAALSATPAGLEYGPFRWRPGYSAG